jgi:colicin import membrane protein
MKTFSVLILVLLAAGPALAQDSGAERARIAAERTQVEARFREQDRACRARFAVTDCIDEAKRERVQALTDLRRQQLVLNDTERKRRAAEHQKDLYERLAPQKQQKDADRRARAAEEQQQREQQAAGRADKRAAEQAERSAKPRVQKELPGRITPQGDARPPRAAQSTQPDPAQREANRLKYEERQRQAEAHRDKALKRAAGRKKGAGDDLPVPP